VTSQYAIAQFTVLFLSPFVKSIQYQPDKRADNGRRTCSSLRVVLTFRLLPRSPRQRHFHYKKHTPTDTRILSYTRTRIGCSRPNWQLIIAAGRPILLASIRLLLSVTFHSAIVLLSSIDRWHDMSNSISGVGSRGCTQWRHQHGALGHMPPSTLQHQAMDWISFNC